MREWTLSLALDSEEGSPLFLKITRAIVEVIRGGRLGPGDALPGSRALAERLGVHRNTVVAAYRELLAEGWIVTERARGTFVSPSLPDVAPRRFGPASERATDVNHVGFELPPPPPTIVTPATRPGLLSMSGGVPDVRLVPTAALARAYRRVLMRRGASLLNYGDPRGLAELRESIARMLSATRGVAARVDHVVVTRGSQMAIDLAARALLRPGDVVAIEAYGYPQAWGALLAAGARLVPIPVDAHGLEVQRLAELTQKERVRAVYVTPHHQYPTTVTLAPGRRLALLELAAKRRFFILEDDYDHEFHYDGRPILPLASADRSGVVVYVGTLSKILAPGLRLGFLVAPNPVVRNVVGMRRLVDRQGDHVLESAIAELYEEGELARHVRRARKEYQRRRDTLVGLLRAEFHGVLAVSSPPGGTAIWASVAPGISADAWAARALERGVLVAPSRRFAFSGRPSRHLRLGFALLDPVDLRRAVERLALAQPRHKTR